MALHQPICNRLLSNHYSLQIVQCTFHVLFHETFIWMLIASRNLRRLFLTPSTKVLRNATRYAAKGMDILRILFWNGNAIWHLLLCPSFVFIKPYRFVSRPIGLQTVTSSAVSFPRHMSIFQYANDFRWRKMYRKNIVAICMTSSKENDRYCRSRLAVL